MIELECKICKKKIGGFKKEDAEYRLEQHIMAKHKDYRLREKVN